jgi:hypothetical protein
MNVCQRFYLSPLVKDLLDIRMVQRRAQLSRRLYGQMRNDTRTYKEIRPNCIHYSFSAAELPASTWQPVAVHGEGCGITLGVLQVNVCLCMVVKQIVKDKWRSGPQPSSTLECSIEKTSFNPFCLFQIFHSFCLHELAHAKFSLSARPMILSTLFIIDYYC